IPVQFDTTLPFAPQVEELVNHIPLTPRQLQTEPILVVLPALNFIAALLLADLHGRMGYFPAVLRLRPVPGSTPPAFEAAEILNLQQIRENARTTRRLDENQSD
ncbi:MAG TPA: CRISPR-associated protein Csx15, partial [Anaerolineaceae bacterium]|nr:CRISPR-associated protein Csx15 [Anaerolineaceae bacterium]